jgi:hypothetical protein
VPQGSVIGYIIYVNDHPEVTNNSTVALFADDNKCYRAIRSPVDRGLLQLDLDAMSNWSLNWKMKSNVSKTLRISRKRNPPTHCYFLNNDPVKSIANQVDLGVVISNDLKCPLTSPAALQKPIVCLVFFVGIVRKCLIFAAVGFFILLSSDIICHMVVRSGTSRIVT